MNLYTKVYIYVYTHIYTNYNRLNYIIAVFTYIKTFPS